MLRETYSGNVSAFDADAADHRALKAHAQKVNVDPKILLHDIRFHQAREVPGGILRAEAVPAEEANPELLASKLGYLLGDPPPADDLVRGALPGLWNALIQVLHAVRVHVPTPGHLLLASFLEGAGEAIEAAGLKDDLASSHLDAVRKHFLRALATAEAKSALGRDSWKVTPTQMAVIGTMEPVSREALIKAIRAKKEIVTPGAFKKLYWQALGAALASSDRRGQKDIRTRATLKRNIASIQEIFSGAGFDGEVLFVPREIAELIRELLDWIEMTARPVEEPELEPVVEPELELEPVVEPKLEPEPEPATRPKREFAGPVLEFSTPGVEIEAAPDHEPGTLEGPETATGETPIFKEPSSRAGAGTGFTPSLLPRLIDLVTRLGVMARALRAFILKLPPVLGGLLPFGSTAPATTAGGG